MKRVKRAIRAQFTQNQRFSQTETHNGLVYVFIFSRVVLVTWRIGMRASFKHQETPQEAFFKTLTRI